MEPDAEPLAPAGATPGDVDSPLGCAPPKDAAGLPTAESSRDAAAASGLSCAHCHQPLERKLPVCSACQLAVHEACAEGRCPVAGWVDYPAPPAPRWLGWLTLGLLFPATGGGCMIGAILAAPLADALELPAPLVGVMLVGGVCGLPVAGLAVTLHRFLQYRTVRRDAAGFALGVTPKWRGSRLPWGRLAGFRQVADGVMLQVKGQAWTRWFGPVVRCEGREVHDLIEVLEQNEVYRA